MIYFDVKMYSSVNRQNKQSSTSQLDVNKANTRQKNLAASHQV